MVSTINRVDLKTLRDELRAIGWEDYDGLSPSVSVIMHMPWYNDDGLIDRWFYVSVDGSGQAELDYSCIDPPLDRALFVNLATCGVLWDQDVNGNRKTYELPLPIIPEIVATILLISKHQPLDPPWPYGPFDPL